MTLLPHYSLGSHDCLGPLSSLGKALAMPAFGDPSLKCLIYFSDIFSLLSDTFKHTNPLLPRATDPIPTPGYHLHLLFFLFVCFFFFFPKTGFLCVALEPVLELALVNQVGLELTEILLPLIKGEHHHCLAVSISKQKD